MCGYVSYCDVKCKIRDIRLSVITVQQEREEEGERTGETGFEAHMRCFAYRPNECNTGAKMTTKRRQTIKSCATFFFNEAAVRYGSIC